jgi:hypothetical protein
MPRGAFADPTIDEAISLLELDGLTADERRNTVADVWADLPEPLRATFQAAGLAPRWS